MKKLLVILLSALLAGCATGPFTGSITQKDFSSAHNVTILYPMPMGETIIIMPMIHYYPDQWGAWINIEGSTDKHYCSMTEEQYNKYEVGDTITCE